jgi:hypothetical protein
MKVPAITVLALPCSMVLMSCLADYPPTQTGGAPEGFTSVPTQAEVEICAKYAETQSISAQSESKQDVSVEGSASGRALGTAPAPTPREGKNSVSSMEYQRAFKDCMSKRGF